MDNERTRLRALVALQKAEDVVIAAQQATDPAATALYTSAATRFFPNENHLQFAEKLRLKIFNARQRLKFARIQSVRNMADSPKYRHNNEAFDPLSWRQITGVPAMAWPPDLIILLKDYFTRSYNRLRPGILAHEAFHLDFTFHYCNWGYMGQMGHDKGTTNDAFAYQGFVCEVANLPQGKPHTRYP